MTAWHGPVPLSVGAGVLAATEDEPLGTGWLHPRLVPEGRFERHSMVDQPVVVLDAAEAVGGQSSVVGRAASSSRVGLMEEAARQAYLDRIRDLLDSHPDTRGRHELELDYVTTAWRMIPRG